MKAVINTKRELSFQQMDETAELFGDWKDHAVNQQTDQWMD